MANRTTIMQAQQTPYVVLLMEQSIFIQPGSQVQYTLPSLDQHVP